MTPEEMIDMKPQEMFDETDLTVMCPLFNYEKIDVNICLITIDVCDQMIKERNLPKKVKPIKNYKEICKKCPLHDW